MAQVKSVRAYAQAAFEIAQEEGQVQPWSQFMQALTAVFSDREALSLLSSPAVPFAQKERLLSSLLSSASPTMLNFAKLVVVRGRVKRGAEIAREFERMVDAHLDQERAEVVTAVALTPDEREDLKQRLERFIGKTVALTINQDTSLVGGIVVKVGGKVVDGSLHTQFQQLKKSLEAGAV
jgi:F-type H+-transporting ATPase subunit delta